MGKEQNLFEAITTLLTKKNKTIEPSQMFGKPCIKVDGKAFACFFQNEMVFKLTGDIHTKAIGMKGATLFDPSGKGRAMKEWVQVPYQHNEHWQTLAEQALKYVLASKK